MISRFAAVLCFSVFASAPSCLAQVPASDHWGERFNSAGATLTFKEMGRQQMADRTVVRYNLYASGLPKGQHYVLCKMGIDYKPQGVSDAYLNDQGKVVNVLADRSRHIDEDPIDLVLFGAKGEPFQFAIVSDDGQLRAFIEIVPFPIEKNSGSCRLSVIEAAPHYEAVRVTVTGLQPSENIVVEMHSEDEGGPQNVAADAQGRYRAVVGTFVKGKTSGKTSIAISAQSCKLAVEFPWGEGSQHYQ